MKKTYKLGLLGSIPKWTSQLLVILAVFFTVSVSAESGPGGPPYTITGAALCQNAGNTLTREVGIDNSVLNHYYLLFKLDATGTYSQVGLVHNVSGGAIQFGAFNEPGKYVAYDFGTTNPGAVSDPTTYLPAPELQLGDVFIYALPSNQTMSFPTGTCMSGSDGSFCAGTGVIDIDAIETHNTYLGDTWDVTYQLYTVGTPDVAYATAIPAATGVTSIQFTSVAAGTYRLYAHRNSCTAAAISLGTITIVDDVTAPTWTTATSALDRTVECSDAQGLIDAQALYPVAEDCHNATLDAKVPGSFVKGSCGTSGTYTNTWTATDDCGNTSVVYTQVITVVDTHAPTWTTATSALDRTLECSDAAGLTAAQALLPEASDLCDPVDSIAVVKVTTGSLVPSGCAAYTGTYTNTFTATDACGNTSVTYTQIITIVDDTDPVFTTASTALDRTVQCSDATALGLAQALEPVATDNCSTPTVVKTTSGSLVPGCASYTGTITNEFTATDGCGNTAVFTQTITVIDDQAPTWTTLATELDRSVSCSDAAGLSAAQALVPVATDNCDVTLVPDKDGGSLTGGCSAFTGTITNTFTVTDDCGNTSAVFTQIITVYDSIAPTWTTLATALDRTVTCSDAAARDAANLLEPAFTDNCDVAPGYSVDKTAGALVPAGCGFDGGYTGTITNTFTVTDNCGNTSDVYTQIITVIDDVAPVVTEATSALDHTGINKLSIADLTGIAAALAEAPTATDNCSGTITRTLGSDNTVYSGPCADEISGYTRTRSWTFTDECGNTSNSFTQIIEVDASAPVTSMTDATECETYNFSVPVSVTKFTNVNAISLSIAFDNTKMSYVDFANNPLLDYLSQSALTVSGTTTIVRFTGNPTPPSNFNGGTLFTLNFSNLSGTGDIYFFDDFQNSNEYAYPINAFENNPFCDDPFADFYKGCTITMKPLPTAEAGANATICEDETYTLSGTIGGGANYGVWSTSGSGTFDVTTSMSATYSPSLSDRTTGFVTLTLTSTDASPCDEASDDMVLTLKPLPTVDAGTDYTICSDSRFETAGSVGGGATQVLWSTPDGTGTFDHPTSLACVYTPSAADTTAGSVTLTLTTTDAYPCDDIDNSITLTIKHLPTVSAGADFTICSVDDALLNGSVGGGATQGAWSIVTGDGTFDNASSMTATYYPTPSDTIRGFVTLKLSTTNAFPCDEINDNITITIKPQPTVSAGADFTICSISNATLSGSVGGGASKGEWSIVTGDGTFDVATSMTATYTPTPSDTLRGYVTLRLSTTDATPCSDINDDVTVTIKHQPEVNAGPDQTVCDVVTSVTMAGYSVGGGASTGAWSGGAGTWTGDVYEPTAGEISSGSVTLTYTTTDASPCTDVSNDMVVTFKVSPTVEAGNDQTICSSSTATLSGTVGGGATEGVWSVEPGLDGTFSVSTAMNAVYTPGPLAIAAGSVKLKLTTTDASPCADIFDEMTVTIQATSSLTGWVKYNKSTLALSPNMSNVTVTLKQGLTSFGTATTNASGVYTIGDVCPIADANLGTQNGTYDVVLTTPRATSGALNATDAAQVNNWGNLVTLTPTAIAAVRFYAGDMSGNNVVNNTPPDASLIAKYFTEAGLLTGTYGNRMINTGLWTFWAADAADITTNTGRPLTPVYYTSLTFPTNGTGLTQNYYGLATGDFNRSFTLSKSTNESVTLNYDQTKEFNMAKEIELPIRVKSDMEVGSVSLVLNLPSEKMEVTNVFVRGYKDEPVMYNVMGNELRIAWYTLNPMRLQANDELLVIKLKATGNMAKSEVVKLELAAASENELSDASYAGISRADLYIDDLKATVTGAIETSVMDLSLTNRPNPFMGNTSFSYTLPEDGNVTLTIDNVLGANVATLINGNQASGSHVYNFDANQLAPGVYTATLKFKSSSTELIRTIKVVRNQ